MPLAGAKKAQSNDSLSSAQSSSSSSNKPLAPIRKQIECVCYSCNRVIAALRLAPHLEKCIGLGRNSSRLVIFNCWYFLLIELLFLNFFIF